MGPALVTSDWIGIGGTAVAIAGFAITLWQLRRVRAAVRDQQRQTAGAILLSRAPDLERIESELRNAQSADEARRGIIEWRRAANEFGAIAEGAARSSASLTSALELSLGLVGIALAELDRGVPVAEATAAILGEISKVCGASRSVSAEMIVEVKK